MLGQGPCSKESSATAGLKYRFLNICSSEVNKDILRTREEGLD